MDSVLYFNGAILTMDAKNNQPEAMLTAGGRIKALGPEAKLRTQMPVHTKEHDLQGQCLIPAFIDPHGHFPDTGFVELFRVDLSSPPRGDCPDIATALERLRKRAAKHPRVSGSWGCCLTI